ncbi:hypothetical protein Lfee_1847 [Legionella feeleii]|uniref:Uncharacterized protein n=1 Tax=Legionella feeleii TaxID=453 RepID=A0A0W0TMV3_9GAMM|nr:hypothetical protein [Legionella feeleii]KTC96935.1 hypothetical protein Lfee_1847 [Legionella feeleii]
MIRIIGTLIVVTQPVHAFRCSTTGTITQMTHRVTPKEHKGTIYKLSLVCFFMKIKLNKSLMDKGFLINKKTAGVHLIWILVQDFYFDWYFLIILSDINLFALSLV